MTQDVRLTLGLIFILIGGAVATFGALASAFRTRKAGVAVVFGGALLVIGAVVIFGEGP